MTAGNGWRILLKYELVNYLLCFFTDITVSIGQKLVKLLLTDEIQNVKIMFVIVGFCGTYETENIMKEEEQWTK